VRALALRSVARVVLGRRVSMEWRSVGALLFLPGHRSLLITLRMCVRLSQLIQSDFSGISVAVAGP
jgi:hypothetical protein